MAVETALLFVKSKLTPQGIVVLLNALGNTRYRLETIVVLSPYCAAGSPRL